MNKYQVDFNRMASEMLPPDKRMVTSVNWIQSLYRPLRWLHALLFFSFREGSLAPAYAPGTYPKYQQVIFNQSVYESLVDNNTAAPTDPTKWMLIQDNFLGAIERVKYNSQVLVLEYALNQWFGTQFRQPPAQSDIFLTMHERLSSVFLMGGHELNSSAFYSNRSTEYIVDGYSFAEYFNMTVNIPFAVWEALDTVPSNRDRFVRSFVNQYIAAGIIYDINPYI